MIVESTIHLYAFYRHCRFRKYMSVFLIRKELHQCDNPKNKTRVSNEGKDRMSNFKMALAAFINFRLMCTDHAPAAGGEWSVVSLWWPLIRQGTRPCARYAEYTGRGHTHTDDTYPGSSVCV